MIVVTTPTGQIGSKVVADLLRHDEPVRIVVRDAGKLAPEVADRVEVLTGSHADPRVIDAALRGAEALFWVVPPVFEADDTVFGHFVDFTRPAADAIRRHGVARVVSVGNLGRGYDGDAGYVTASIAMTGLLESTGAATRVLSNPGFMENLLQSIPILRDQGVFYGTLSPERKVPQAATEDIAAVGSRLLLDHHWLGHADVPVLGPEDLSSDEVAQILSEVLGKPIRYQQIPLDALRQQLEGYGAVPALVNGMIGMVAAKDKGLDNIAVRTPDTTTPTTLRDWAERNLKPALAA